METDRSDDNLNNQTVTTDRTQKPKRGRGLMLFLLSLILFAGGAVAGYWWRGNIAADDMKQKDTQIQSLQVIISALKKAQSSVTSGESDETVACSAKQPGSNALENIKAAITSGNTAALEGYMASSVAVVYAASEGVGDRTPAQAVADVTSFLGNPTVSGWSFDIGASTLSSYGKGSYGQYFPATALVAKSDGGKVISLLFDCNGKISTVFMVTTESVLQ